jgi:PDZ domain-containing protein
MVQMQTDPQPQTLAPFQGDRPPGGRTQALMRVLAVLGAVVCFGLVAVIVSSIIRVPYFSEGPGPAHDVLPLIEVKDRETFPTDGKLMLTTVSFSSDRLTALQYLMTQLDPDQDLIPESELLMPGVTIQQESELQGYAMDQSQLEATAVALRALGEYPPKRSEGAIVEATLDGCEAAGQLFPGNSIVAIDGVEVTGARSASDLIDSVGVGEPISFTAMAGDEEVNVDLKRSGCGPNGEKLVGVSLIDPFPVEVNIDDAGVGGPSAGLMLALGIYDKLTPGSLTDGAAIAGTGQIDIAGNVYAIGGVEKKLVGAQEAGATVFLVPRDNLDGAKRAGIEGVKLVPVDGFDDALAYFTGDTVAPRAGDKEE